MIYFVERLDDPAGPIKIGCTRNLPVRLKYLRASYGCRMRPLGVLPGSYEAEVELHDQFWHLHAFYEWFHRGPDLMSYISARADIWGGWSDYQPPQGESADERDERRRRERLFEVIQKRRISMLSRGFKGSEEEVKEAFGGYGLSELRWHAKELLSGETGGKAPVSIRVVIKECMDSIAMRCRFDP